MPGRYEFSMPERPMRDGWFRIGTVDVTTTALLVGLGVASMFLYAADKTLALKGAYQTFLVRDGELWRLVTWPLLNPPTRIWVVLTLAFFWFVGHFVEDRVGRVPFTVLIATMTVIPAVLVTILGIDEFVLPSPLASPLVYTPDGGRLVGVPLIVVGVMRRKQGNPGSSAQLRVTPAMSRGFGGVALSGRF